MEKKYTPKERREIYKKAAEWLLVNRDFKHGCCYAILNVTESQSVYDKKNSFEELQLFKPREPVPTWWWYGEDQNNQRIIALLLMAEMTREATE